MMYRVVEVTVNDAFKGLQDDVKHVKKALGQLEANLRTIKNELEGAVEIAE